MKWCSNRARQVMLSLLMLLGSSLAQPVDIAAIETFIQEQMARHAVPGVAIAITQGEQVIYSGAFGIADSRRPLTPDTPMYIGSTAKSFTALAIMQLVEAGKLDLAAPVQRYIPWFSLADPEAAAQITVQHLLGHSSGLSDLQYVEVGHLADDASIEDGVRDLQRARPVAPVGSSFRYFNPGYATLGLIIERVSGQSYTDYIEEHIFAPLTMQHSYTDVMLAEQGGLAQGYSLLFGFPVPRQQVFRRYGLPAGYIMSTANDMARYLIAMNNRGRFQDARLLSLAGMLELHRPSGPGNFYAKGWMVASHRGLQLVQHGGANEFFKSEAMLLPERELGLVVLINQGYLPSAFTAYPELAYGLLDLLLGETPAVGLSIVLFGRLLLLILILMLLLNLWQFLRLKHWKKRALQMSAWRRNLNITLHFLIGPVIIAAVWIGFRVFMQRGFSPLQSFDGFPDGVILLLVGIVADYAQGIGKIWLLRKSVAIPGSEGRVFRETL